MATARLGWPADGLAVFGETAVGGTLLHPRHRVPGGLVDRIDQPAITGNQRHDAHGFGRREGQIPAWGVLPLPIDDLAERDTIRIRS